MLIDDLNETLEGIVSRVLQGGDTEVVLDVPEDWAPGSSQLQLFFEQVIETPEPLSMPRVRSLSSKVRVRRGQYRGVAQLQVARHSVPVWGGPRALFYLMRQGFLYGSDNDARLAALLLGLGYHTPSCRSVMERSVWEMQLLRRLPEVEPAPAAGRDKRHEGWIRYTIRAAHPLAWTPTGERLPDYSGLIERQIVRLSKKGDRELQPIKMPRKFEDAEAKIRGITDADRKIDAELRRLMACAEVFRTSPRVTQLRVASSLVTEGVEGIFSALADARDVWLEDDPIEVEREPMTPTMSTSVSESEALLLKWRPGVRSVLSVGRWYVLDWNGVLKPLSSDFPESMRPLLTEALPKIPSADVSRFLEVFARRCPLPLELDPGTVSGLDAAESVEKRLFLEEEDGGLKVGARFAYMLGEVCVEIEADDRGTLLPLPDTGMIKRRADWEAEALAELGEAVGIALPARLEGDVAHDFLLDVLPVLSESWAVYGDRSLKQHQVQGSLAPEVVVGSGIDWFDVDVRFTVGDTRVGTGEILQSWLDGRRYHRLADGSVARLPDRWLAPPRRRAVRTRRAAKSRGRPPRGLRRASCRGAPGRSRGTWRTSPAGRRLIRDLTDFEGVGELTSAAPLQATLRDYQVRGVRWLTFLRDAGLGGVLADDMGLGKTIQVLAALSDTHAGSRDRPSLVVAPASVVHNWALEAQRFAPWLEVHIHRGKTRRDFLPVGVDLIVTSYNLLRIDRELFESTPLRYAILDEAQHIKNPDSQVARSARALNASHRLALTGTPLEKQPDGPVEPLPLRHARVFRVQGGVSAALRGADSKGQRSRGRAPASVPESGPLCCADSSPRLPPSCRPGRNKSSTAISVRPSASSTRACVRPTAPRSSTRSKTRACAAPLSRSSKRSCV